MQRIRTYRYKARNIGGDRARAKLFYTTGQQWDIPAASGTNVNTLKFNTGAANSALTNLFPHTISSVLGQTPYLSVLAQQFQYYRIRGIKMKLTYWQSTGDPVFLYANAQSDSAVGQQVPQDASGPTPAFPAVSINIVPEQRWAKYRTCQMTSAGGKPTSLSVYYSVNKVQGPDRIIKNDQAYTGDMQTVSPYWGDSVSLADTQTMPVAGPWLQYGISTLSGAASAAGVTGVLKTQATVYAEFWGKRVSTQ